MWLPCGRCDGTGGVPCSFCDGSEQIGYAPSVIDEACTMIPCPDCVSGRVPPAGMVEAAAEAMYRGDRKDWEIELAQGKARLALIAAKRWELDDESGQEDGGYIGSDWDLDHHAWGI